MSYFFFVMYMSIFFDRQVCLHFGIVLFQSVTSVKLCCSRSEQSTTCLHISSHTGLSLVSDYFLSQKIFFLSVKSRKIVQNSPTFEDIEFTIIKQRKTVGAHITKGGIAECFDFFFAMFFNHASCFNLLTT